MLIDTLISTQFKIYNKLKNILAKACIDNFNNLANKVKLLKQIGTSSINGEVFESCIPIKSCNTVVVVKKVPITRLLTKNYDKVTETDAYLLGNESLLTEIFFLHYCNNLLKQKVTCNLPVYFNTVICKENCKLNKNITRQYSSNPLSSRYISGCGYILAEKAEGDLRTFLRTKNYSLNDILVAYYHVFNSLLILQTYSNLTHGDLHYGNVLYRKIPKDNTVNEIIEYKNFTGKIHRIPNIGFCFFPWDFGASHIRDIFINEGYSSTFENLSEYERRIYDYVTLIDSLPTSVAKNKKYINIQIQAQKILQTLLKEANSLPDFLDTLALKINPTNKKGKVIGRYDLNGGNSSIINHSVKYINKKLNAFK